MRRHTGFGEKGESECGWHRAVRKRCVRAAGFTHQAMTMNITHKAHMCGSTLRPWLQCPADWAKKGGLDRARTSVAFWRHDWPLPASVSHRRALFVMATQLRQNPRRNDSFPACHGRGCRSWIFRWNWWLVLHSTASPLHGQPPRPLVCQGRGPCAATTP